MDLYLFSSKRIIANTNKIEVTLVYFDIASDNVNQNKVLWQEKV